MNLSKAEIDRTSPTTLPQASKMNLDYIREYDLWFLRERLLEKNIIELESVDLVLLELKRFFELAANMGPNLPMISEPVDQAWHEFIIFTRRYTDFCTSAFGHYYHHVPRTSRSSPSSRAPQEFLEGYRQHFGKPSKLWNTHLSDCSDCGGSAGDCGGEM